MTEKENNLIVGLDIGTTKVTCVAAIENEFGGLEIIGLGTHPSQGMSKGLVCNMDLTINSISKAVEEAQRMAGLKLSDVIVGIAGGHIDSQNTKGLVAVRDKVSRIITEEDKKRALEGAETLNIPQARVIIQSIPQEYKVDEVDGVLDPLGMVGVRLEVKVHIITAAMNAYQNIINCVTRAKLNMKDIVLESLASAEAVLSPQEMDVGAAILDIGGGTTDIGIFSGGVIKHSKVIPIGGNNITADLAMILRTSNETAEFFKVNHGCCLRSLLESDEPFEVPFLGGNTQIVKPSYFCEIQEKRVEELIGLVHQEFLNSGIDSLVNEVVVTGGTSLLPGLPELAQQVLGRPVRLGVPRCEGGLSSMVNDPRYSTAIGLILHGLRGKDDGNLMDKGGGEGFWEKMLKRFRGFVEAD
jgi:cell division protein FtsA